jgi:hypothetical protein
MGDLLDFPSRKYVRFYRDYVECDWCGQLTRGRVYEGSQEIVCGACSSVMFEFETTEEEITFELDEDECD